MTPDAAVHPAPAPAPRPVPRPAPKVGEEPKVRFGQGRLAPGQQDMGAWGSEPFIWNGVVTTPPVDGLATDYIVRHKATYRTSQTAWEAYLTANPTFDPNWERVSHTAYLTACPFPGRT
jgi:hypothetical protein